MDIIMRIEIWFGLAVLGVLVWLYLTKDQRKNDGGKGEAS